MATTRKPAAKKAAKKPAKKAAKKAAKKVAKKAAKKSARKSAAKGSQLSLAGVIPKMKLTMPLDAKKIAAIQRCIQKGTLTVTLSKVDLSRGRLGDPWLYD